MTAHVYWDQVWRTSEGRADWSLAHPWLVDAVPELQRIGVRDALDLGCGVGRHAFFLAEQGFQAHGADRSDAAVTHARAEADRRGLSIAFDVCDFTALPYPADSFDLVLAFNVIYHTDEDGLGRALDEVRRVLRPGGVYHATMLSKRNREYGRGVEVSRNTFVQPTATDDKIHPHLYVDAADLVRLHDGWQLVSAADVDDTGTGGNHWYCRFELGPTTQTNV
jgi:tellurite methyltransferase